MSTSAMRYTAPVKQRGLTLIELIIFIVVVSVGIAGILMVLNVTVWHSADPMIRKNMLSIAEALVEEVQMMPFTYCDPDDANAATAISTVDCALPAMIETLGRQGTETNRIGNPTSPFDNVSDYYNLSGIAHGLGDSTHQITNIDGTSAAPLGYTATITVANDGGLGPAAAYVPSASGLRIAVTVTHGSDSITVEGYRTRYAPKFLP